jgi:hypothetical protein
MDWYQFFKDFAAPIATVIASGAAAFVAYLLKLSTNLGRQANHRVPTGRPLSSSRNFLPTLDLKTSRSGDWRIRLPDQGGRAG